MKKKRLANIVMVLLIVVIAVTGVLTAFHLRGGEATRRKYAARRARDKK